ncbi:endoglucanase 1 [Ascobolus immersus RN42]|uniref:Glucanase n=1 Tax=Ascobolus immersus RN42 TaxID=1160509 RepID=A0A3N4HM71_ASCIM|nr:endoglucanase 1 [Ascobolus immersus RN42]
MAPISLSTSFVALALLSLGVHAQTMGQGTENHPRLTTYRCTKAGGCQAKTNYIVLDNLAHPVDQRNNPGKNCGNWGEKPDPTVCPDEVTCQNNCIVSPIADYSQYGVSTSGDSLRLDQLKNGKVVTPRVYLLEEGKQRYEMTQFTGGEFAFDVDISKLPCGMNGALYLSEMEADGGKATTPLNKAGAYYGTGYCDAQCFTTPFINGAPNMDGSGSCCNEMDIWEANSRANGIAPHTCRHPGLFKCQGEACEWAGDCDEWGCTYNPYKVGQPKHYGRGAEFGVDTTRKFTVVTQFPANARGEMIAIRRLYVQDGKVVKQATVNVPASDARAAFNGTNEMNDAYCLATGGAERYLDLGGTKGMGAAMSRGMVLIFSLWWDESGNMQWMDGSVNSAGPCDATEGSPAGIVRVEPNPTITFSNIKWGELDSTYQGAPTNPNPSTTLTTTTRPPSTTTTSTTPTTTQPPQQNCSGKWGQCGK